MTTKTYLIHWDVGCGPSFDVVRTKSEEAAVKWAYENWKDEAEGQSDYGAELATKESLEDAGFDPDEYFIEENE